MNEVADAKLSSLDRTRFHALWDRQLVKGINTSADPVWLELIARYGEPHRRYHDARHIAHCLAQLDTAVSHISDRDAVEMALWFHDVILDPGADDNEENSARLFARLARDHMSSGFVSRVWALILATTHQQPPQTEDAQYVVDIDLSSMGLSWERFVADSSALREEQPDIPEPPFIEAKRSFLRALLDRPRIFFTDFFHDRYESTARQNLRRYLAQLERA